MRLILCDRCRCHADVPRDLFRKQGFVERVRRSYNEHRLEGQAFFSLIVEQGGPILIVKGCVFAGVKS
jgi:hypothetical protein